MISRPRSGPLRALGSARTGRWWAPTALFLCLTAVAAGTLGPSPAVLFDIVAVEARGLGLEWVDWRSVEVASNVLVFVPLGFLLRASLPRLSGWVVWGVCSAASASVELVQHFLPDRQPSLLDLVTNSAGAAAGVLLAVALTRGRRPTPGPGRVARRG